MRLASMLLLTLLALAVWGSPAQAVRVEGIPLPVRSPAEHLVGVEPDPVAYDPATRCMKAPRPGMTAFVSWLGRNADGSSWGTYRCELWGRGAASLHAEGRAVDWHLDSRVATERAAGRRLIALLLAPDSAGTPHALARRMGVQEIIWDCSYWGAGGEDFGPYSPCFSEHGERRRKVNATVGHLDHLHIGLTRAGAAKRTSWWRQAVRR